MTFDSQLREEFIYHNLHRTTLPNGLRVWVKPRPGTGTVALLLQVPVGSRHETEANNGISHFLEHLLFTGTAKWNEALHIWVVGGRVRDTQRRDDCGAPTISSCTAVAAIT